MRIDLQPWDSDGIVLLLFCAVLIGIALLPTRRRRCRVPPAFDPILGAARGLTVLFAFCAVAILLLPEALLERLGILSRQAYELQSQGGRSRGFVAWLYTTRGVFLPLLAGFGWMAVCLAGLMAGSALLPKGRLRRSAQIVMVWEMLVGMVVGFTTTMVLAFTSVSPVKNFLVWMMGLGVVTILVVTQKDALLHASNVLLKRQEPKHPGGRRT